MSYAVPTDEHGVYLCCSGAEGSHMPGCPVPELVAERDRYRDALERIAETPFSPSPGWQHWRLTAALALGDRS